MNRGISKVALCAFPFHEGKGGSLQNADFFKEEGRKTLIEKYSFRWRGSLSEVGVG